ncbi:hypothetical protein P7B02_02860 [Caulobacter segnis]|uniref:hypothetical protein n=1 Tax=Caulobacter segnis TaxID=88688 RepID=UPI00241002F2|nr:hypothetical protein [Caulobacter segnis]MDG2520469.1 hypothetical protein [Caulobacter segnis]
MRGAKPLVPIRWLRADRQTASNSFRSSLMRIASLVLLALASSPACASSRHPDTLGVARGVYAPIGRDCSKASSGDVLIHDGSGLSDSRQSCRAKVRRRTTGAVVFDQICRIRDAPEGIWRQRPVHVLRAASPHGFTLDGPKHAPAARRRSVTYQLCRSADPSRDLADDEVTKTAPGSPAPRSAR